MKNYTAQFDRALQWVKLNSIDDGGMIITSKQRKIYPEVTGYYIPTLLQWGEKDLAIKYAKKLCSMQKNDGSWYDPENNAPYIFDTAQILKGLIEIRSILPEVDVNIINGCDWILTNMQADGRLVTPDKNAWGNNGFCSELIHIYCLSPIKSAGEIFGRNYYIDKVDQILTYYIENFREDILNFKLLSHFYAYVLEGLIDLGREDLSRQAMYNIEQYQKKSGAIPGLRHVKWVCSTGLFQLALVWYKLGELDKGNKNFYYALSLQNKDGGWYGSYPYHFYHNIVPFMKYKPGYFQNEEISWAIKYFFDALAYKEKLEFNKIAHTFSSNIDENDGRFVLVEKMIQSVIAGERKDGFSICDVGCGKGRYLTRLAEKINTANFYATDLSDEVMKGISDNISIVQGRMTNLPFNDEMFDFTYTIEALEHSINVERAFKELLRITKKGGTLLIIDKPAEKVGKLKLYEWEKWISDISIKKWTEECGAKLKVIKSVAYEGKDDGLFRAWIVRK